MNYFIYIVEESVTSQDDTKPGQKEQIIPVNSKPKPTSSRRVWTKLKSGLEIFQNCECSVKTIARQIIKHIQDIHSN